MHRGDERHNLKISSFQVQQSPRQVHQPQAAAARGGYQQSLTRRGQGALIVRSPFMV